MGLMRTQGSTHTRLKNRLFLILLALAVAACSLQPPGPLPLTPEASPTPAMPPAPTTSPATAPTTGSELRPVEAVTPQPGAETPAPPTEPAPTEPTPAPVRSRPRYVLTAELDYARHYLAVDETIFWTSPAPDALSELRLMAEPASYPGVFRLLSLTWEDGHPVEDALLDGNQITVPLRQPLAPGEGIVLHLAYELYLPMPTPSAGVRPVPFGYSARQTNLVDWYPFVAPYVPGQGWLAHRPYYYGEHLAYESADFEVNVRLTGSQTELTVAASALEQRDGDWRRYQLEAGRNFAWSVSHDYVVTQAQVGDVTVLSYAFPLHAAAGEAALQTTTEALALFSELFGPYPHPSLTVVEADFLDGMEYDGLYFLSNGFYNLYAGTAAEYLVAIAAHETAHMWWYALVGNDQAQEPWLDEALCTYSERLYYERVHPDDLTWWWTYRINYYDPRGWVDTTIYNPHGSVEPYRSYRDAVYLNGARFLEALRRQIGEEAFFAFLKDYAARYAHQLATGEDFFSLLETHTAEDLSGLVGEYFELR